MDPYSPLADVLRSQHDHVKIAVDVEVTALDGVASAADTADASSWILAVVANVDKGFEETALLVLKRRRKDQSKAKVVDALPVLKDFRFSIAQAALDDAKENGTAGGAAIEGVGMAPALSELGTSSRLCLTLLLGGKAVVASSDDAQNVKDLLSVLRASVQVAEDHSDQLSHDWLRHYVDDYEHNSTDGAASAPIFSRFTQSALFPAPPSSSTPASPASAGPRQRAPSPAADEVKITIGTFNVNGQAPTAATTLGAWLHPEDEPDILVVSLQEADASSLSYVYWTPHVQEAWDGAVRGMLARRAGEYERVAARQLVGILLFVYVRKELLPRLSHVALTSLGVGLGGWAANKGAVAARFEVDGTSLCFVASHLSAFEGGEARERRRWDYGEIVRRLSFTYALDDGDGGGGESDEKGKAHQAAEDPASTKEQVAKKHEGRERKALDLTMTEPDAATLLQAQLQASLDAEAAAVAAADAVSYEEATIFDHDVVFWAGDLNFRLELPIGEIKRLIRKRMFEGALLRFDELRSEMSAKSCFEGFQEQPITFAPTYKFDRGTDEYDTSEKKRKPAWTDRILWRCRSSSSSSSEVRPVSYESAPEVLLSDHKPVSACFIVKIGSE